MKKFFALIKYVFFPYIAAQAAGTDFSGIIGANEKVTAVVQTETSYWVGTHHGLWCITKTTHKAYHITAENSVLPSNHVNDVCVAPDGNVYAATDNGLFRYDGYAYLAINSENANLPTCKITAVKADANNNLWIGTAGMGLYKMYNYKTKKRYTLPSVLTSNFIKSITQDENGVLTVTLDNKDMVKIMNDKLDLITEPSKPATALASN